MKTAVVSWDQFIKDYLSFTRKERIGILVIVGLILFTLFLPGMLKESSKKNLTQIDTAWMAGIKKLEIKIPDSTDEPYQKNTDDNVYAYQYDRKKNEAFETNSRKGELFYFDPNTITASEWKRLGLRDKTIQTIEKYLNRGGYFYKPDDLQKIYGLYKDEYERLAPYVKIEPNNTPTKGEFISPTTKAETETVKSQSGRYTSIDINTADTSAFISLPGIGSKLASRIVTFREKLGGFYSIDQVGETYGLADSTFQNLKQYLKLDHSSVKKININTATIDEMKAHPYIKYSIANPLVAYRNEHGAFSKIEDIKKVMAVTDEIYNRIAPYLTL